MYNDTKAAINHIQTVICETKPVTININGKDLQLVSLDDFKALADAVIELGDCLNRNSWN